MMIKKSIKINVFKISVYLDLFCEIFAISSAEIITKIDIFKNLVLL